MVGIILAVFRKADYRVNFMCAVPACRKPPALSDFSARAAFRNGSNQPHEHFPVRQIKFALRSERAKVDACSPFETLHVKLLLSSACPRPT
jgi:hypothetical protein